MQQINLSYKMVMVDDDSKDTSTHYLTQQAQDDNCVKAVILCRNFGQEAALSAGLEQARGEAIIGLDADLQNALEMLQKWRDGADIVAMQRPHREGNPGLKNRLHICIIL